MIRALSRADSWLAAANEMKTFGFIISSRTNHIFFFQAEDGIRDHCVTGVQTCALPISSHRHGRVSNSGLSKTAERGVIIKETEMTPDSKLAEFRALLRSPCIFLLAFRPISFSLSSLDRDRKSVV